MSRADLRTQANKVSGEQRFRQTRYSREQDRGQSPASVHGVLVGRPPGLEELHQLFAGTVVVPFAVAAHDLHQLIERFLTPVVAVERERKIEPRLVVERIIGDLLLELGDRAK